MKWSYRSVILAGLLGMLLAGWVANRSSFSANNDAYLQVLAADGFRDGSGYGFHQNGEFISISARTMMSRWPPGLTALAAGLAKLGRDPLVSIVSIYPVLILATYLVLAWSLAGYLGAALACWTAFGALTPWCVMTYHSKLSTEPFALLFAAVLFALILQRKPTQTGSLVGRVVLFVVAAVGLTMFRNAGAYLVVVGVPLFVWFHGAGIWPRLRLAIVMGLCSLLPLMTFHWIAKAQSMKVAPPAKGGAGTGILSQLNGNLEVFAEALVPRISFLDARHSNLAAAIGWGLVLFVAASGVRELARRKWDLEPREDGDGLRVVMVGLALALACVVMLAVSADQFGYDWSSVYRVKGFALPWIIAAFASGLVLLTAKNPTLRPLVMAVIILTSSARFVYAWRAPLPDLIIPLCAVDYRGATDKMLQAVAAHYGQPDTVAIYCDGHWSGRNFVRQLWYADRYHQKLPWTVREARGESWTHSLPANTVLIVARLDFRKFESQPIIQEHQPSDRLKLIDLPEFIMLGAPRVAINGAAVAPAGSNFNPP